MATIEVREYQTAEGKIPLTAWLEGLRDGATRARIVARLDRLKAGLLGDWKSVGGGIFELRIDHGPGYRVCYGQEGKTLILLLCGGDKALKRRTSRQPMRTGKTTKPASPSRPFRAADHLRSEAEVAAYIEAMLEDGDARAVPVALRTVVDAVGGMAALADKTGLSRETLYRTLSERGNPRLDTLAVILAAFGLRLTVQSAQKSRSRRSEPRPALA
jgi:putative addiction module killer protein/probable addiction module antidote protein